MSKDKWEGQMGKDKWDTHKIINQKVDSFFLARKLSHSGKMAIVVVVRWRLKVTGRLWPLSGATVFFVT